MFQRDHTQNFQHFWGEGGETSAKQTFLTQLLSAKSRAEISPDGENRVGQRSEQATDFFKEKIRAATTAKPRRGGAPEKACFFGEKEAKRPQSRRFSPNSFWPKAGPKFRLTAKTELGEGRSSDDCKATKGRGPQKCLLFWGEGGETSAKQTFLTQLFSAKSKAEISPDGENRVGRRSEQATDFFKEKIGAATTAKPRRGWGPRKSLLFWGEGGMTERMRKARPKPGFQAVEKPSIL